MQILITFVHYKREHPNQLCPHKASLRDLFSCKNTDPDRPQVYVESPSKRSNRRPLTDDELSLMGAKPPHRQQHGVPCRLTKGTPSRKILPNGLYETLPNQVRQTLLQLDRKSNEIAQLHQHLTLPTNCRHPNSLNRVLAIDMIQNYQELVSQQLEQALTLKNEISTPQDHHPERTAISQEHLNGITLPTFKIEKAADPEWVPCSERFEPGDTPWL